MRWYFRFSQQRKILSESENDILNAATISAMLYEKVIIVFWIGIVIFSRKKSKKKINKIPAYLLRANNRNNASDEYY